MKVLETKNAPGAIGPYSQGFEVNGFVYTSGQIPVDPATGAIPEGIAAQTEQSCKNVGAILEAAGAGFDKEASLELVQDGICTLISWGGVVLWGDHTAAYKYGAEIDPRFIFDVNVRMIMHVLNGFQRRHMGEIDEPMSLAKKDEIINEEQEQLDALAAMGALIGTPTIYFLESENSTVDLMNGDFKWNIPVTPTPPLKSATAGVAYTDSGFAAYFEEV